jgi:threonine aldolase
MRQAGVLAAAGIYALDNMVERLADDHAMARRLAEGIGSIEGLELPLERVKTNILFCDVVSGSLTAADIAEKAAASDVLVLPTAPRRLRMVTHYGLTMADIDRALEILQTIVAKS